MEFDEILGHLSDLAELAENERYDYVAAHLATIVVVMRELENLFALRRALDTAPHSPAILLDTINVVIGEHRRELQLARARREGSSSSTH